MKAKETSEEKRPLYTNQLVRNLKKRVIKHFEKFKNLTMTSFAR
jgi:hypothetical protein